MSSRTIAPLKNKRTKVLEAHRLFWHFSPFQIKTQLSFWRPFWKSTSGHFGCLKFIFICISRHFRLKLNFDFFSKCCMYEIHFRLHFSPFQIQLKLSFFFKMATGAILDVRNSFSIEVQLSFYSHIISSTFTLLICFW